MLFSGRKEEVLCLYPEKWCFFSSVHTADEVKYKKGRMGFFFCCCCLKPAVLPEATPTEFTKLTLPSYHAYIFSSPTRFPVQTRFFQDVIVAISQYMSQTSLYFQSIYIKKKIKQVSSPSRIFYSSVVFLYIIIIIISTS